MFNLKPITVLSVSIIGITCGMIFSTLDINNGMFEQNQTFQGSNITLQQTTNPDFIDQQDSNEEIEISEEELEGITLQAIDQLTAHPKDPQKPILVRGLTDEELLEVPKEDILYLLDLGIPYAEANSQEPRFLFSLGRAAYIHGDEDLASELLIKASQNGSPAADAYLGLLSEDIAESSQYFQRAIQGGFKPAEDWLKETTLTTNYTQNANENIFDPNLFNKPELIKAFYEGETVSLQQDLLSSLTYASAIHDLFSDTSLILFMVEDRNIITEIDPQFSIFADRKLLATREGVNQAINAGLQSIFGPLMAMATTRQRGGSIQDEIHSMNSAILDSPAVKLNVLRKMGDQDGKRLAIMYDTNPEAFRRVYAGLKKFILEP